MRIFYGIIFSLILAYIIFAVTATDEAGTIRVLTEAGYTTIETQGKNYLSCSTGDVYATNFTAISPSGHQVTGVVCSGFFKGNTIRLD